jgi:hypothetical protein
LERIPLAAAQKHISSEFGKVTSLQKYNDACTEIHYIATAMHNMW